jgi:hypothetical protein
MPRDLRASLHQHAASVCRHALQVGIERGAQKMDIAVDGPLIFDDGGMIVDAV